MGACLGKDELGSKIPRNEAIDCTVLKDLKSPIVFLIGGPGSGKGTLSGKLASKFGYTLINPSNLLRSEVSSATERGEIIEKIMKEGRNVPADVVVQLVEEKMVASSSAAGFLVVGFPRDKKQASIFAKDAQPPSLVIVLEAKKALMEERMKSRAEANERFDDTPEVIALRIKNYMKTAGGAAGAFKKVTTKINAELSQEEVFEAATAAIEAIKPKE